MIVKNERRLNFTRKCCQSPAKAHARRFSACAEHRFPRSPSLFLLNSIAAPNVSFRGLTEELVALRHDVALFASGDSVKSARLEPMWPRALRLDGARSQRSSYDDGGTSLPTCEGFRPVAVPPRLLSVFRDVTAGRAVCDDAARASDLPEHKPVFSTFSSIPLVSISNAQRRPVPNAKWIGTVYHGLPENLLKAEPTIPSYLAFLGRISPEKPVDRAVRIAERCGLPLKIAAKVDAADQDYFVETILPLLSKPHVDVIGEITDAIKSNHRRKSRNS